MDRSYLDPYNHALNEITVHVDKLAALTTDNQVQQRRIARLRELVAERLRLAKEGIDLEEAGKHAQAVDSVASNAGKRKWTQFASWSGDMRNEEELLLRERTASSEQSLRRTIVTFVVATLAALIFC